MLTSPGIGSCALDRGLWKDPFYLHFTSTYNQTKQTDIRLTKNSGGDLSPFKWTFNQFVPNF